MALLINRMKLKAAASSMHQFCPVVRNVFPDTPEDGVVESVTLFLYLNLAQDIFGRRFTKALGRQMVRYLKFSSPREIESRLGRIKRKVHRLKRLGDQTSNTNTASPEAHFQNHIAAVVRTMLSEAGIKQTVDQTPNDTYIRFEQAVRRMKEHLLGIQRQHHYLMN